MFDLYMENKNNHILLNLSIEICQFYTTYDHKRNQSVNFFYQR
jgi:hypothetical protein